jgi:hypothetical protein
LLTEVFEGLASGVVTRLYAQEVRGGASSPGELSWLTFNRRGAIPGETCQNQKQKIIVEEVKRTECLS